MHHYFVQAHSFAAPFFSDETTSFIKAESPREALKKLLDKYDHPAGLYAANCYYDANAFHKGEKPLARWRSNHELALQKATKGMEGHVYLGISPGVFEINHKRYTVPDPKGGRFV